MMCHRAPGFRSPVAFVVSFRMLHLALTGNIADIANTTEASAPVIPAGTVLFGKFTAIDLHSGRIVAYTA